MVKVVRLVLLGLLAFLPAACELRVPQASAPSPTHINGQIAFCGRKQGNSRFDIYLLNLPDDKWTNLTEKYLYKVDDAFGNSIGCDNYMLPYRVAGMAWSPKGDLLLVDAGGPNLNVPYALAISDKGDLLRIVRQWPRPWPNLNIFDKPQEFSWSPSGDKVAFVGMTASDGYNNLFIGDISDWARSSSNTSVVQMTEEYRDWPGVVFYPAWSPDGGSVAVSLNGHSSGVMIIPIDASGKVHISEETSKLLSRVEDPASPWIDSTPSWFPDGKTLIFIAATRPNDRTALFKVNKDGQNLQLLVPAGVVDPRISPDGKFIAYVESPRAFEFGTIARIIRIDADGQGRQELAAVHSQGMIVFGHKYYVQDLAWSPDSRWLLYSSNNEGRFQLYVVSVDGGPAFQIANFPGDAVYPQWRPLHEPQ